MKLGLTIHSCLLYFFCFSYLSIPPVSSKTLIAPAHAQISPSPNGFEQTKIPDFDNLISKANK
jgi:hypothetical protein